MPTLNAVFKQVFGEALAPLGFVKIKGKQPYLVRVVEGGEIIHVITYKKFGSIPRGCGYGEFRILSGVATVYRRHIDLEESPNNASWLNELDRIYAYSTLPDWDKEFLRSIIVFRYRNDTITDTVRYALRMTEEIVLPVLDKTVDIDSCIDYFLKFESPMSLYFHYTEKDFANSYVPAACNEGLLWVKLNNRDAYMEKEEWAAKRRLAVLGRWVKDGETGHTQEQYEEKRRSIERGKPLWKARYDEVFADREWIARAQKELERRKALNTKILVSLSMVKGK